MVVNHCFNILANLYLSPDDPQDNIDTRKTETWLFCLLFDPADERAGIY